MCTLILLTRPGHEWPLLVAANRDEMLDRPWMPPATHWPDQPGVIGGLDTLAGGTWLAVNRAGVTAGVLNRANALGPEAGRKSRGELPLLAMRHPAAAAAADALAIVDAGAYRPFNLVIADAQGAWYLRGLGEGSVIATLLDPGLHMVTAHDPDDLDHPRVSRHLPKFALAPIPRPPDWSTWPSLLADAGGPVQSALNVPPTRGFGTASSTLLALGPTRHYLFAAGPPDRVGFERVAWEEEGQGLCPLTPPEPSRESVLRTTASDPAP